MLAGILFGLRAGLSGIPAERNRVPVAVDKVRLLVSSGMFRGRRFRMQFNSAMKA